MFEGALPGDIVNRALDALGRSDIIIGDLEEGSEAAKPALRAYGPAFRQLLRSAHWTMARKMAPLTLLADATGQTPNVGTKVIAPWTYEYELPIDCVRARFLPWNSNPILPNPPIMTNLTQPPLSAVRLKPAPFLQTTDFNYPAVAGVPPAWSQLPQWWLAASTGPVQRAVICTNVAPQPQGAAPPVMPSLVYTALIIYPSQWDDLFQEAMVAFLGQKLAMSLVQDKKLALQLRAEMIKTVKVALDSARAESANESGYPQTTDHVPDWLRARNAGAGNCYGGSGFDIWSGPGVMGYSWEGCGFADGSVY